MESNQEKRVVEIWNHLRPHIEWPPKKKKSNNIHENSHLMNQLKTKILVNVKNIFCENKVFLKVLWKFNQQFKKYLNVVVIIDITPNNI